MKKAIIFFLLLISTLISTAQDLTQLETQADEWSKKSFTQSKALSGYLACFRQTKDKDVRLRVMDKMCMVINNKRLLLSFEFLLFIHFLSEDYLKCFSKYVLLNIIFYLYSFLFSDFNNILNISFTKTI